MPNLNDFPDQAKPDLSDFPDTNDFPDKAISTTEQPSFLSRTWHALSEPLTDMPSRFAKSVGDYVSQPVMDTSPTGQGGFHDYLAGVNARMKGFGAGAIQGAGDVLSSLSSPINLATAALTGGESIAAKAGLPEIASLLNMGSRAASVPVVLHGANATLSPSSTLGERAQGLAEVAGGGAAMLHTPNVSEIPSGRTSPEALGTAINESGSKVGGPISSLPGPSNAATEANAGGIQTVDPFQKYRQVGVGTTYKISPENMSRKKMADAIRLGFEYNGLDDVGRIILRKAKESPAAIIPEPDIQTTSAWAEAANLPRTILASEDLSAPLRQGLGLIHKKAFWTSLPDMVKAFGSEDAYKSIQQGIFDNPIFKKTFNAKGELQPSFAEKAGLSLTDLNSMSTREESMLSSWAEKIPGVRPSNRAYTAFLNKLRADTFTQMINDFGVATNSNSKNNLALAQNIAEFVNTASGRGSLGALEPSAKALSSIFFSPRLMASRLGMMAKGGQAIFSPEVYMLQNPSVRREYLKSLFAIAGTAGTFVSLSKMAGASVETDPASSDFGKVKFGNTRIDPYGGFQQYIVAAQRLMPEIDLSPLGLKEIGGRMKSTTTGNEYSLGDPRFGRSTRMDVLTRFMRSKTNPIINFGWGLLAGQKELSGKPMNLTTANPYENAVAQRFMPMLTQDIYDMVNDSTTPPSEKAMAAFMASLGMGTQTYSNEK